MALASNDIFAGCRIVSLCGRGGNGEVYLAEDAIGRRGAIKIFDSPEAEKRELRGIKNYMRLGSPMPSSLITIHHAGQENGHFYYLMDLADNAATTTEKYVPDTLSYRLKQAVPAKRLPLDEALKLCLTLLDGIEAMHQAGLLHRDIKPENILFVQGRPVLGDPGGSGDYTHTLSVTGTLGYIPPELLRSGSQPTPSADIYALGKVLYVAITGKSPDDFPDMPVDLDISTLVRVCRPLGQLCNALPSQRCQNCTDCRRLLLDINRPHGRLWTLWRRWEVDVAWRRCVLAYAAAVLAMVLVVVLGGVWGLRRHQATLRQAQEMAARQDAECARRLETWQGRENKMRVQLTEAGINFPLEEKLQAIEQLSRQGRTTEALSRLDGLDDSLKIIASEHIPPLEDESKSLSDRLYANGRIFGYLASPLGKWFLPESLRSELADKAEEEAAKLSRAGGFPKIKNGKAFLYVRGSIMNFIFVPPGQFLSPVTGKIERINHPFWMLESELSLEQMQMFASNQTLLVTNKETPATRLGWNDCLALCLDLNKRLSQEMDFPPGYGFRPPTEAEWEFAALGGMTGTGLGKDTESPVANEFGLLNLDRNLAEIVQSYPNRHCEGWGILRGASFQDSSPGIENRHPVRLDQVALTHFGFRPVLALVAETYYRDVWYFPKHPLTAVVDGKAYADFETCVASTSWQEAQRLAADLGGCLPEPQSRAHLNRIIDALKADWRFPMPLGIRFQEQSWRTISDNLPSSFAAELASPIPGSQRLVLASTAKSSMQVTDDMKLPVVCVEFSDPEALAIPHRLTLEDEFEIDGRHFALLRYHIVNYMHQAFLNFVGYESPIITDATVLARLLEHLKPFKESIDIGLHAHGPDWCWRDLTPLEKGVMIDLSPLDKAYLGTRNYSIVVARDGHLEAAFKCSDAILVEIPQQENAR